jgi:hypothetical protein
MTDEGGVLGNLPNARPGRRSTKRDAGASKRPSAGTPAKTAAKAASRAEAESKPAAKPARSPKAARTSAKPGRKAAGVASPPPPSRGRSTETRPRVETAPPPASEDPVGAVVRTAAGLAATGMKVGGAVARELLRRLPRP